MAEKNSSGAPVSRPLSPHLQIYRLPLLAVVSILNRVAGVALSGVLVLAVVWLAALASSEAVFNHVNWFAKGPIGILMMIAATFGIGFHGANGVRHLIWDWGKGFAIPVAERGAKLVVAFAVVFTVAVWAIIFGGLI